MIEGKCHCGKVSWTHSGPIDSVTACNCSICRRYGSLWAYGYKDENISVQGITKEYVRDKKEIGFHFCPDCGCTAYWLGKVPANNQKYRIAVNTRLAVEPKLIENISIRHFDGLGKFAEDIKDQRCVRDMWF